MEPIKEVSCGNYWTFLISNKGEVWTSGANHMGQLGLGHKNALINFNKIEKLARIPICKLSAGHHTAALSIQGELFFWGTGVFGEFLYPKRIHLKSKVVDLSVGDSFGLVVDENKKIWTWGANNSGELGMGDYEPHINPSILEKLEERSVVAVSCGGGFAMALGITHNGKMEVNNSISTNCNPRIKELKSQKGNEIKVQSTLRQNDLFSIYDPTISSDLNGEDTNSLRALKDPNQQLLRVITHQRDCLEEIGRAHV